MKFARPNQKIRFGRMIASVGRYQCVHANGFIVLKLVAKTLGEIRLTLFRNFACSVNSALVACTTNASVSVGLLCFVIDLVVNRVSQRRKIR